MSFKYDTDSITALAAIAEAQKIAFAPVLFQVAICLRDFGMLEVLNQYGNDGCDAHTLSVQCNLNPYAVDILLDAALSGHIVYQLENKFFLGKIGHYLLHDQMTKINMNFIQDVCYEGLVNLKESLLQQKPVGLKVFGDWQTIYPALSQLPEQAQKSWFEFDHFYSDAAFYQALKTLFSTLSPLHIYDVGGNTGKWAIECCKYDQNVQVTILDLPAQLVLAEKNIDAYSFGNRIHTHPVDMLDIGNLPNQADVWWMSQFLDCFSPEQIINILKHVRAVIKPDAKLCILEVFSDAQPFEAGAFSVNMSSLYFACMANGNSRFYRSDVFLSYLEQAGFQLDSRVDNLGIGHSLLVLSPQENKI